MKVVTGFESSRDPLGHAFASWVNVTAPIIASDREEGVLIDPLIRQRLEDLAVSLLFVRLSEQVDGRYRLRFTAYSSDGLNVTDEVCTGLRPAFHRDALERLVQAINQLSNADGLRVAVLPKDVLQEWVLEQVGALAEPRKEPS